MPEYGMGAEGMGVGGLVIWLIFAAIIITPFWKIYSKSGILQMAEPAHDRTAGQPCRSVFRRICALAGPWLNR
jgi:hypothetical protein